MGWICVNVLPGGDCAARFSGAYWPRWRLAPRVAVPMCLAALKIPSLRPRAPISNGPPINSRPPHCSLLRAPRPWSASRCRRLNRRNRSMRLRPPHCSTSSLNMRSLSTLRLNMRSLNTLHLNMRSLSILHLNMRSLSILRLNMRSLSTPRLNMLRLNILRRHMNHRRHEQRPITPERSAPAQSWRTQQRRACRRLRRSPHPCRHPWREPRLKPSCLRHRSTRWRRETRWAGSPINIGSASGTSLLPMALRLKRR